MQESGTAIKPLTVFISYAKEDEETAQALREALTRAGYRTATMGEDIAAGDRWIANIFDLINASDIFVVLLSKAASKSHWIDYETAAAIAAAEQSSHKRVIPVALDRSLSPSGLLASYQWVFASKDPAEVTDAVLKAIEGVKPVDKAQERRAAREGINQDINLLDAMDRILTHSGDSWRTLTRLALLVGLLFTTAVIAVVLVLTKSASISVAASLGTAFAGLIAGVLGTTLGYRFGRLSKRSDD